MPRTSPRPLVPASTPFVAAAAFFYAFFVARTSIVGPEGRVFVLFEDAMISLRYAKNFAAGAGLVWNPGEAPVEGYTNFLWTLFMSVPFALGVPASWAPLFVMAAGAVLLFVCGELAARLAAAVTPVPWAPAVARVSTLFAYPLVFWTLRGMEVGALAALIAALALLVLRLEASPSARVVVGLSVLGAVAVALRSDAIIAVGVVGLYGVMVTRGARRFGFVASFGGVVGLALVAHAALRLRLYGDVVPNTYYLKLYGVPLAARLARGLFVTLRTAGGMALPLAVVAAAAPVLYATRRRPLALLGTLVAAQAAYGVYVGGDAWEWMLYANRYVSAVLPLVAVLVAAAVAELGAAPSHLAAAVRRGALALALGGGLLLALEVYARLRPEVGVARTVVGSKTMVAAGLVTLVAGAVALAAPVHRRIVAALGRALDGLAAHPGRAAFVALAAVCLWAPVHGPAYGGWLARNAAQFADEARYARLGLLLREAAPGARIGVVAAGATPFFSELPAEDLLGKNDPVVARRAPVGVFSPGHDKWDYPYSLGHRRPALVVELADVSAADAEYIASLGYEVLPSGLYVQRDAPGVRRDALAVDLGTDAALTYALGLARGTTVAEVRP